MSHSSLLPMEISFSNDNSISLDKLCIDSFDNLYLFKITYIGLLFDFLIGVIDRKALDQLYSKLLNPTQFIAFSSTSFNSKISPFII